MGVLLVLLSALTIVLLWSPIQIHLRWRKPWQGRLVYWWHLSWGGKLLSLTMRREQGHWQLGPWQGTYSLSLEQPQSVWCSFLSFLKHKPQHCCRLLHLLLRYQSQLQIDGILKFGFQDPVLTAQGIMVLAALPPVLARRIYCSFSHSGWSSQGHIHGALRLPELCPLLLQGIRVWSEIQVNPQGRETAG